MQPIGVQQALHVKASEEFLINCSIMFMCMLQTPVPADDQT